MPQACSYPDVAFYQERYFSKGFLFSQRKGIFYNRDGWALAMGELDLDNIEAPIEIATA